MLKSKYSGKLIRLLTVILTAASLLIPSTAVMAEDAAPAGEVISEEAAASGSGETESANQEDTAGEENSQITNLTATIRGLSEEDRNALMEDIQAGYSAISDGDSLIIDVPPIADAEKYSTDVSGYDSELCWAAAAANMLWTSGYAQEAVNPATGTVFKNEDEVFDYFRHTFTDQPGYPYGGVSVFINGQYPYTDSEGTSQLKNPDTAGLLPDIQNKDNKTYGIEEIFWAPESISSFEKLTDQSMSVELRSVNRETQEYGVFAHSVTAVGIIYDQTVQDLKNRYKALIVADSDDSPADVKLPDSVDPYTVPEEERASLAAAQPNRVTVYPLTLISYGDIPDLLWSITKQGTDHVYDIIINAFSFLKDKSIYDSETSDEDEPPAPAPDEDDTPPDDEPPAPAPDEDDTPPDDEPPAPAPDNPLPADDGISGTDAETSPSYDFTKIKELMVSEDWIVYSPENWEYDPAEDTCFDIFVRTPSAALRNVYLDEELLPRYPDVIRLIDKNNGIFLLRICEKVMKELDPGPHSLLLQLTGIDDISQTIHVKQN